MAIELGPHPVGNLKIWVFWKIWEKKTPVFSYCAWKFGHSTIDVWGIFQADHRWVDWVEWFGTRTFVCLCEVWVLEIVSTRWFWKFNTLRTGKSTYFEVRCLPSISIQAMASSSQTVNVYVRGVNGEIDGKLFVRCWTNNFTVSVGFCKLHPVLWMSYG